MLIVEDNEVNRLVARDLLQYGDAQVDTCKSAAEALEKIASTDFEVIFVDCHMPGMSGYELAERIKQNNESKHLYIIALTADISRRSKNRCMASGMDDFISKPYLSSDLFVAINKYIQSKEKADNALNKIFSRD